MKDYWWLYKGFEVNRNKDGQTKVFMKGYSTDFESIATENPTPVYVINGDRIREKIITVRRAFETHYNGNVAIHFAMKECHIPHVLNLILSEMGCGVDAASPNEARLGLRIGVPAEKIMFTGPSISETDMKELVGMKVRINVDSFSQLRHIVGLVKRGEFTRSLLPLSIRINPNVGAGGDEYSVTGGAKTAEGVPIKFGMEEKKVLQLFKYARQNGLVIDTLHFHIGSGWFRAGLEVFRQALRNVMRIYRILSKADFEIARLDVGGGAGVRKQEEEKCFPWGEYATVIAECTAEARFKPELLILEPGDGLVLDSGVMLTMVNSVEEKHGVKHVFVDSGMGSFPAVRLYREWHEIINVSRPDGPTGEYAVDGNCCETGDTFTCEALRSLPEVCEGDVLAFLDTVGFVEQSFNYCLWGRPHVMLRKGDRLITCTRGVETLDQIMSRFTPIA